MKLYLTVLLVFVIVFAIASAAPMSDADLEAIISEDLNNKFAHEAYKPKVPMAMCTKRQHHTVIKANGWAEEYIYQFCMTQTKDASSWMFCYNASQHVPRDCKDEFVHQDCVSTVEWSIPLFDLQLTNKICEEFGEFCQTPITYGNTILPRSDENGLCKPQKLIQSNGNTVTPTAAVVQSCDDLGPDESNEGCVDISSTLAFKQLQDDSDECFCTTYNNGRKVCKGMCANQADFAYY